MVGVDLRSVAVVVSFGLVVAWFGVYVGYGLWMPALAAAILVLDALRGEGD